MERVYLALGSNLGDRLGFLRRGLQGLVKGGVEVQGVSSVVESPAVGPVEQSPFLNLVAVGGWEGGPAELLALARRVEAGEGRTRPFPNAPRTLDVDLIFFGCRIVRVPGLRVPHPRWKERRFVVGPLRQIAPGVVDPETGFTVGEISRLWPQEPVQMGEVLDGEGAERFLEGDGP